MTRALKALFPGAVVFALAVFVVFAPVGTARAQEIADTYGMVVYGAGLALAWVFHRSRVLIVLASIALVDSTVGDAVDRADLIIGFGTALLLLIACLAPTRDRGITSRAGLMQLAGAGGIATAAAQIFSDPAKVQDFAVPMPSFELVVWPGLPLMTVLVAGFAFVATAYGFYRGRGPVDRALIWSLILILVAMHPQVGADGSALFLLASGLTLTLSVVEMSYILAYRDDLTGLPGRRALMQALDNLHGTYSLAMVDVDHFKKFNDKHGHDVGDQVLKLVASRLEQAPGGAKAYRYGGEEFTLLLPGMTSDEATPYLESVRISVEKTSFAIRSWNRPLKKPEGTKAKPKKAAKPKTLSVTVSMGVADSTGEEDSTEDVLKRADEALYRAKKAGRNRLSK